MAARRVLGITVGVVALIAMQAKAGSPSSSALQGAALASGVPVYPGAHLSGEEASAWSRTLFGPPAVGRRVWSFTARTDAEHLVEFYSRRLPDARRAGDGRRFWFELIPAGAAPGESVRIIVGDGTVTVEETTLLQ